MPVSALDSSNVSAYRELMLEAYEQAADAFTTTAAERRAEPESWWIKRIGSASGLATSFGAWDEGRLVGTVAIEYSVSVNFTPFFRLRRALPRMQASKTTGARDDAAQADGREVLAPPL